MSIKQRILFLGLLGILGFGGAVLGGSPAQSPHRSATRKISQQSNNDDYTNYVNSLTPQKIIPPNLSRIDKERGCDKDKLKKEHTELSNWIQIRMYRLAPNPSHSLWQGIDDLISIDTTLANCFYRKEPEKYVEKMIEIIEHYQHLNREGGMGQVYYYLFALYKNPEYLEKAREYLKMDEHGFEAYLRLTPKEELPKARDEYLQQEDHLRAGKIEWYLGNRERGRELIIQSKEFPLVVEESRKAVLERDYEYAIGHLWRGLRIPFTGEIIKNICKDNKACLKDLERYGPNKDKEFFTI